MAPTFRVMELNWKRQWHSDALYFHKCGRWNRSCMPLYVYLLWIAALSLLSSRVFTLYILPSDFSFIFCCPYSLTLLQEGRCISSVAQTPFSVSSGVVLLNLSSGKLISPRISFFGAGAPPINLVPNSYSVRNPTNTKAKDPNIRQIPESSMNLM